MKVRSRLSSNFILSSIFTAVIVLGSYPAKADVQSVCSFKSYSVAEVTPAFEVGSGISDEYKSERLKLVHSNQITDKKFGSVNRDFLKFKALQVDGLLNLLSNGSADKFKLLPENGDVQFVFWENERPFFYSDFWFPKYIDQFLATPKKTERIFDSPWVKIRSNPTACKLTILTLWNIRQFIADEASKSGSVPPLDGVITARNDTPKHLPQEFYQEVIGLRYFSVEQKDFGRQKTQLNKIKDDQSKRLQAARHKFPPELFWLYSSLKTHAGMTGTGDFGSMLVDEKARIAKNSSDALLIASVGILTKFLQISSARTEIENRKALLHFLDSPH
jgi:hypothetical protein